MFNWLRNRRRGELREAPFPEEWYDFLRLHVAHYVWLTDEERERLQGDIQVFIAEKEWEGIKASRSATRSKS
jgi:Mlc titration factor MtfA (ptsG expression regulator)